MENKKRKKYPFRFEKKNDGNQLSKDEVIRYLKADNLTCLKQLQNTHKMYIDNYAYMIINNKKFAEKYECLLSLSPLNVLFYQDLVESATEECFESYFLLVKNAVSEKLKTVNLLQTSRAEVWKQVGNKYRFSLVVSFLIKMKKEKFLKIVLNDYVLTPEEECLLLECYRYYEDCRFLEWYFSHFTIYAETFDMLCYSPYDNMYKLYSRANGAIPFKYKIRRWKKKLGDVVDNFFFGWDL